MQERMEINRSMLRGRLKVFVPVSEPERDGGNRGCVVDGRTRGSQTYILQQRKYAITQGLSKLQLSFSAIGCCLVP